MKETGMRLVRVFATALAVLLASPSPAAPPEKGWHVDGVQLLDGNDRRFIFRGVNVTHAWTPTRSLAELPAIAKTGANGVRIALGAGCGGFRQTPPDEVRNLIDAAKAQKLAIILEVHDATSLGSRPEACAQIRIVDYWKSIADLLRGQERYLILNIANEPRGGVDEPAWIGETIGAVQAMRAAGFRHLLMIDAPGWGQDAQHVMRDHAARILAADPLHQIIFSIHMYGEYDSDRKVTDYIARFRDAGLALVVGEFGNVFRGTPIPVGTVVADSVANASGYLAWSWSGNGGPDHNLDLVDRADPAKPTPWGNILLPTLKDAPKASIYTR
jgi:mannan endo-1,4-beta-mannosidase